MGLVVITLILILIGVVAYFAGAYKLAQYGFRLSRGTGLLVLLFPPYTFFFALKKLEVDGKELPTAMCSFGLIVAGLMIAIFWQPLFFAVTGDFDEVQRLMHAEIAPASAAEAPETPGTEAPAPEPAPEPEPADEPADEEAEGDDAEAADGEAEGEEGEEGDEAEAEDSED
jgi:hypothetical protein